MSPFQPLKQAQEPSLFKWRTSTTTCRRYPPANGWSVRRMESWALCTLWLKTKTSRHFLHLSVSICRRTMMENGRWQPIMVGGCIFINCFCATEKCHDHSGYKYLLTLKVKSKHILLINFNVSLFCTMLSCVVFLTLQPQQASWSRSKSSRGGSTRFLLMLRIYRVLVKHRQWQSEFASAEMASVWPRTAP